MLRKRRVPPFSSEVAGSVHVTFWVPVESTRQRYQAGAATLTELTTAQSGFVEAQYDQVDAELKKVIQAMTLSFYRGDMAEITGMVEK